MLDIKVNKGEIEASMEGNVGELTADMLVLLHSVFHRLYHINTIEAVIFKSGIEKFIGEAFTLSSEEVQSNE